MNYNSYVDTEHSNIERLEVPICTVKCGRDLFGNVFLKGELDDFKH